MPMALTARRTTLQEKFQTALAQVQVVSFDVFDTLYVRNLSEPEGVFDLMATHLRRPAFRSERIAAQTQGFQKMLSEQRKEIDLSDIYCHLPNAQPAQPSLSSLEQSIEHSVIRVNPEVAELFREARRQGKTLVYTSDMYLPVDFFRSLAERYDLVPDHYFVSSECNCTKRDDGELFEQLKLQLKMKGADILHIGDNRLSDITRAEQRGLRTLHYIPPSFGQPLSREALEHNPATASLCLGLSRYACYQAERSPWFRLGWQYGGPLVHGFLSWINQQTTLDRIDKLIFVSRDGYLLHQLHHAYPHNRTDAIYLRGSRVSFSLAALSESNFCTFIPFLLSGSDNISVEDLFTRIGATLPDEQVLVDIGLSSATLITQKNRPTVERFLVAMRYRILQVARQARRGLYLHLQQLGIEDGMKVAFVDVGWSGTTQEAFNNAVRELFEIEVTGYYLGLSESANILSRKKGIKLKAFAAAELVGQKSALNLYENRAVAELFFSAPHSTTIGYRPLPSGQVTFIEDNERGVDYDIRLIVESINAGIISYVEEAEELFAELKQSVEQRAALSNFMNLVAHPTPEQARLIGGIYNWDAWASTESYRIYFASHPENYQRAFKPNLWPAGWKIIKERSEVAYEECA